MRRMAPAGPGVPRTTAAEPKLTALVSTMVGRNGGKMEGLDFRLKGGDSLRRKIEKQVEAQTTKDRKVTPQQIADRLFDVNRYTGVFNDKTYATSSEAVLNTLRSQGYKLNVKNYWTKTDNPYQGINVQVTAPDGTQFELQFHTDESLAIKNGELHTLYEKQRVLKEEMQAQIDALMRQMFDVSRRIPVPPGVGIVR
jgi:hypothetical protein